ncbi:MAG: Gfo/Idh/MocA family oxidoreductase, partial [Planctomycetota bacterium]
MRESNRLSRREFLAKTGAAISIPYLVPSGVLAVPGRTGANERLTIGMIGVGGMGKGHLKNLIKFREAGVANIAAVCDIDEKRLAAAVELAGVGVEPYRDYRKAMVAAAKKYKSVVQVGSQARSAKPAHDACRYIRNGMIGRVHKVTCWHRCPPQGSDTGPDTEPPANIDWDMWLGPMRWRPHNAAYYPAKFRQIMDSGGGMIRDRGAHVFSIIRWCLDADRQAPVTVKATGTPPTRG